MLCRQVFVAPQPLTEPFVAHKPVQLGPNVTTVPSSTFQLWNPAVYTYLYTAAFKAPMTYCKHV